SFKFTPIAQANVYHVYRGSATTPLTYLTNITCKTAEATTYGFNESATPPVGVIFYYLIAGTNRCGDGTIGLTSAGQPRPISQACTAQGLNSDADPVLDIDDNCPRLANPGQADRDHDGRGDACD